MANSEFWRNLAKEFRSLNCTGLRLSWIQFPNDDLRSGLFVADSDQARSSKIHFEALCMEAGLAVDPDNENPAIRWLAELKKEGPNNTPVEGRFENHQHDDGSIHRCQVGTINDPCLASATLCNRYQMHERKAEVDALKAHRSDQEQRDDFILHGAEDRVRARLHEEKIREQIIESATQAVRNKQINQTESCTRSAEVDEFLRLCNAISVPRIYRKHIWQSVGHSRPRQFEY